MAFSSAAIPKASHHVFLSFKGEDTRHFASHLHEALSSSQISTFSFNEIDISHGDSISQLIFTAIEESMISVIIFSEGYADSRWCLKELAKILQCRKVNGQIVIPVFYGVDPSNIKKQTGRFGVAFDKHKECLLEGEMDLDDVRSHLDEAANISGWNSQIISPESKLVKSIVGDILNQINRITLNLPSSLVGIRSHVERVETLLCLESPQIRIVGLWGMGGIGKTTIARAVFEHICSRFDAFHFVENVSSELRIQSVDGLRKKIVLKLLKEKTQNMGNHTSRHDFILKQFQRKKVLIVLDDIDDAIKAWRLVAGEKHLFSEGSRILLTSRDKQVLKNMVGDQNQIYEVEGLNEEDSLRLFGLHAFKQNHPTSYHMELSRRVLSYARGNPLALCVLGHALFDKSKAEWVTALDKLREEPFPAIQKVLRSSYDALCDDEKKIFLDIASFLVGETLDFVVAYYRGSLITRIEHKISNLVDKSLITISKKKQLEMNDLLKGLSRSIDERKKIWDLKDITHVSKIKKPNRITNEREPLGEKLLPPETPEIVYGDHSGFEIKLTGTELSELPKAEKWEVSKSIHLNDSQLLKLPENPRCPVLEVLSLKGNSKLRTIPPLFFDSMPALRVLDLSRTRIKSLPDSLFNLPELKRLFLKHCNLLMKLSPKVGQLKDLQVLDLEGTEIMNLPEEVKELKNLLCLKVSFCELPSYRRVEEPDVRMISPGTLSALPLLEELSINVSPDGRWNECVKHVVSEVSGLACLCKLQFYFPSMEFLIYFQWSRFKAFKLTAGHLAAKRLMPRLPSDAEAELERYKKTFTSVHGDFESEMNNQVLQHADALFLDRHTTMKTLSVSGLDSFKHLRCCVVGECNELRVLFCVGQKPPHVSLEYLYLYYMKSLRHIWEGRLPPMVHLKSLTLRTCPMLSSIFSEDLIGSLKSLKSLQEIIIDDCPAIINLVRCNGFKCTSSSGTAHNNFLPRLKRISLHYLPQLNDIFDLSHSRYLEWMSIYHCPNLKSLPIDTTSNKKLNKIMGERSWWESLEWQDAKQHSWDDVFVEQKLCY